MRSIVVLVVLLLGACADIPSDDVRGAATPTHIRALLIAADDSIPAFGNATWALRTWLHGRGVDPAHIQLVGGRAAPGPPATLTSVLAAIGNLQAGPGDSCLVYVTGHGVPRQGIYLRASDDTLGAGELDQALQRGCAGQPTVIVMSGCFSGFYLDGSLPRDNRIILTAARRDRTSFGCGIHNRYTYFDGCILQTLADDAVTTWQLVQSGARSCVSALEAQASSTPSEPQMAVGHAVGGMPLPARPSS